MKHIHSSPDPHLALESSTPDDRREAIAFHMTALEELADPRSRIDGWTPFSRKLFLSVLAETGRVSTACETCRLSKQSAYALRARDRIFAAGWDAACELARMPLADALYEQALDGLTDPITRDDGSTITRHRFDSRLSIAVLNRLDRRCDRAAERGSAHLGAVGAWDDFTSAVGRDDGAAAQAILDAAKISQPSQLVLDPDDDLEHDERVWWNKSLGEWRTDFAPPEGFEGTESHKFGEPRYHRSLTDDELDLVSLDRGAGASEDSGDAEADRECYFGLLRAEFYDGADGSPARHAELGSASIDDQGGAGGDRDPETSPG